MFDPTVETPVPLSKVPNLDWIRASRGGRKLHIATPFRWAQRGINGHRLETLRCGGVLCTSQEALRRFFERLTEPDTAATARTSNQRARALHQAEKELEAAGL